MEEQVQEAGWAPGAAFLKTVHPFSALTDDQITKISQAAREELFPQGTLYTQKRTNRDQGPPHHNRAAAHSRTPKTMKTQTCLPQVGLAENSH